MATTTTNLGLTKPTLSTDAPDFAVVNANMDTIDANLSTKTDLASTASGKGASLIGIQDSAGKITATTVEGALAELAPVSGTWTPVFYGSGMTGTTTYARQTGRYYKIGKLVYITAEIYVSTHSGSTGYYIVQGLPFTPLSASPAKYFLVVANDVVGAGLAWDIGGNSINVRNATGMNAVAVGTISTETHINISGCYIAA